MHVNFIPVQKFELNLKTLKAFKLNRMIMVIVAGGFLFLMIFFGAVQKARLSFLESKKNKLEIFSEEMKQKAVGKGVNVLQTTAKLPAIRSYEGRIVWSKALYDVSRAVPSNIWINSFNGVSKDRLIQIAGEGSDHPSVAVFVDSLSNLPIFRNVALLSSEVVTDKNITKMKFQIEGKLK